MREYVEFVYWADGDVEENVVQFKNDAEAIAYGQDEFEFFPQVLGHYIYRDNEQVFKADR